MARGDGFTATAAAMRIAELAAVTPDGSRIEFRIQRRLCTPNDYLGMHWRSKLRERRAWQTHFLNALINSVGVREAQKHVGVNAGLPGARGGCLVRRRVELIRYAPTRNGFIRDDDNLRFAVKPINDALKNLGLIRDDRRQWIELAEPQQDVSADRTWWTWVAVSDLDGSAPQRTSTPGGVS